MDAAQQIKRRTIMSNSIAKQPTNSKLPTHIAYHVRERAGSESFWTRIGSAWAHADGQGFNIQIETVPLDGRISLRVPSEKTK
jgi:hypothetical protein